MLTLDALSIPISDRLGIRVLIFTNRLTEPERNLKDIAGLPHGWMGVPNANGCHSAPIIFDYTAPDRGLEPLHLKENIRYYLRISTDPTLNKDIRTIPVASSLEGSHNVDWNLYVLNNDLVGDMRVAGYLGTAWVTIADYPPLRFEIVPDKIDYEIGYRSMVEAIASQCQQLLLELNSPVNLPFSVDASEQKRTLLEQFLFLRHQLSPGRLELYLEMVTRLPHQTLFADEEWVPTGQGLPIGIASAPLNYGRDWNRIESSGLVSLNGYLPAQVLIEKLYESVDTPPNRFVKFAFETFRRLCEEVLANEDFQGAARSDAIAMLKSIDTLLSRPFFRQVNALTQLPLNNTTLQKGDGYRQILQAWLLVEAAARLDWPGREAAYDGNSRDVATLYEYWLYFTVYRILRERLSLEESTEDTSTDGMPSFIHVDRGRLKLTLRRGTTSCSRFVWRPERGEHLSVLLFYNRYFQPGALSAAVSSYSRAFKPDYTLVIFPERFSQDAKWAVAEERAIAAGQIAYLHFDAKYRAEVLEELFGNASDGQAEGQQAAELDAEKERVKVSNTYKRGDLYKMHTYNDAIRRTVGSYVLYPGSSADKPPTLFRQYHELLPGVGAFAVSPAYRNGSEPAAEGEETLAAFIADVLKFHQGRFSQLYRIGYWTRATVSSPPTFDPVQQPLSLHKDTRPALDTVVLKARVKWTNREVLETNCVYYLPAIFQGPTRFEIDSRLLGADYLLALVRDKVSPMCWEIKQVELVANGALQVLLPNVALPSPGDISHYYVFHLEPFCPTDTDDFAGQFLAPEEDFALTSWLDLAAQGIRPTSFRA